MTIEVHPGALAMLVRAVAVLALPSDQQVAWLESLGLGKPGYADELGMELRNGYLLASQFEEARWINSDVRRRLAELHDFLESRNTPESDYFWEVESLREDLKWKRVREMAFDILCQICPALLLKLAA